MFNSIKKLIIGDLDDKHKYKQMMKRIDDLPKDYNFVFKQIQKYINTVGGVSGDITMFNNLNIFEDLLDLFEESRDNYFAHLGNFKSTTEAQQKVMIGNNRINLLIEECSKILSELIDKFEMDISIERDDKNIGILEAEYKELYNRIENSYE